MGNCLDSSAKVDASFHSHPSSTGSGASKSPFSNGNNQPSKLPIPSASKDDSKKNKPQILPIPRTEGEILSSPSLKAFSYNELKNASKNFRDDSLLGEGGFGLVYKGWIDQQTLIPAKSGSGMVVAIKKLKPEGFQGHTEWLTEVNYLGQLHHPNLVKLIGYCLEGENRLLVYEFMPKGSLENHLFRRGPQPLSWAIRIKVAIGAARGLSFLHDAQVIFRDFKASNILLDAEFNSKLSDFGLAKAGPTGDRTHVSTRVMGTQGYAAPEYVATGRLSARSDVYSFGVVLLELLTGRPALDKSRPGMEQSLVDWSKPHLGDKRKIFRIMDTKLGGQYPQKAAMTVASLALKCLHSDPKARPKMSEALEELEKLQDQPKSTTAKYSKSSLPSAARLRQNRSPLNGTPVESPLNMAAFRHSPRAH
ncbi:hypothetical protein V2J09_019986 [Rumex salicifolius]